MCTNEYVYGSLSVAHDVRVFNRLVKDVNHKNRYTGKLFKMVKSLVSNQPHFLMSWWQRNGTILKFRVYHPSRLSCFVLLWQPICPAILSIAWGEVWIRAFTKSISMYSPCLQYIYIYIYIYIYCVCVYACKYLPNPRHVGRTWHKVNFSVE